MPKTPIDNRTKLAWDEARQQYALEQIGMDPFAHHRARMTAEVSMIDQALESLAKTELPPQLNIVVKNRREFIVVPQIARSIGRRSQLLSPSELRIEFPFHVFSPYFELWEKHHDALRLITPRMMGVDVAAANNALSSIHFEARKSEFRSVLIRSQRNAKKNRVRARKYIDKLFERYSRLLVIRIDLGINKDALSPHLGAPSAQASMGNKWLTPSLVRFLREQLPGQVGYVWKKEFGPAKGWHVHMLVLVDGHSHHQDVYLGALVGEEWRRITDGLGTYWLCNQDTTRYEFMGRNALGLVDHSNLVKRGHLEKAVDYLAKMDAYVRYLEPRVSRTFATGQIQPRSTKRGRPRNRRVVPKG